MTEQAARLVYLTQEEADQIAKSGSISLDATRFLLVGTSNSEFSDLAIYGLEPFRIGPIEPDTDYEPGDIEVTATACF